MQQQTEELMHMVDLCQDWTGQMNHTLMLFMIQNSYSTELQKGIEIQNKLNFENFRDFSIKLIIVSNNFRRCHNK